MDDSRAEIFSAENMILFIVNVNWSFLFALFLHYIRPILPNWFENDLEFTIIVQILHKNANILKFRTKKQQNPKPTTYC